MARALEDHAQLERCREIIPATNTLVCRLTASITAMEQRLTMRETGIAQQEYVARVRKLNDILNRVQLEDFAVANENRPLTEVALEVLGKAGWI
jgi:phosphosulfolactate synthase (CoM biosynthesis protein A)